VKKNAKKKRKEGIYRILREAMGRKTVDRRLGEKKSDTI